MKALVALFISFAMLSSGSATAQSTLDQVKSSGKFRIGYRSSEPPMSFKDTDGAVVGYSIDICNVIARAVAEEVGMTELAIEFVPVDSKTRFSALSDNKIDILCGSTTKTLARQKLVDFTQLTFVTGTALLSKASGPVTNIQGLSGKKVAVVERTTTIEVIRDSISRAGIPVEIVPVKSAGDGAAALENGSVDAYSADQVVLVGLVLSASKPETFVVSADLFSFEPFALAVRRNDADFRLVANSVISRLYRSGQIVGIYRNWFGAISNTIPGAVEAMFTLGATPE